MLRKNKSISKANKKEVTINGKYYHSLKEASENTGLVPSIIHAEIRRQCKNKITIFRLKCK